MRFCSESDRTSIQCLYLDQWSALSPHTENYRPVCDVSVCFWAHWTEMWLSVVNMWSRLMFLQGGGHSFLLHCFVCRMFWYCLVYLNKFSCMNPLFCYFPLRSHISINPKRSGDPDYMVFIFIYCRNRPYDITIPNLNAALWLAYGIFLVRSQVSQSEGKTPSIL